MDFKFDRKLDADARNFLASSIERSYKTRSINVSDDRISVEFEEELSEELFAKLVKELLFITKNLTLDKIFENSPGHKYDKDPTSFLEESGDVKRIADGLFMFQGLFWKLFQTFHDYVKELAKKYDAIEQEYPVLWPVDLFKEINYFKEFPQQVILAAPIKDNFESRNSFAQEYGKDKDFSAISMADFADESRYGLQPAVCDICYYALRNETGYENKVYTTYNKVFRNEVSKTGSLDRLINFSVRDIMFVGDKNFVLMMRQHLIDEVIEFVKLLGLDVKIETANDPFFCNESVAKNVFQSVAKLKYEILAKLNYSDSYMAVGSINLHLDFFGKAFNIKLPDGSNAYSGCLGIGFERLVFAFFCQYGHDSSLWPTEIKERWKLT